MLNSLGRVCIAIIICSFFLPTGLPSARDTGFQSHVPPHRHNRTDHLDDELRQKETVPGNDAFIKGYASEGVCCSYYGLWHFASRGTRIHLMPNHLYRKKQNRFYWECRGDQITLHWPDGAVETWQRQRKNRLIRTDVRGGTDKAVRLKDFFVIHGRTYTACPGYDMDHPDQAPDIPRTDRAKKISGSMGCQWGLARGSLKPGQPAKWELATTQKVVLKFKDPYKKGEQHYFVRAFFDDGEPAAQTRVEKSATLSLGPGTYTIHVTTDLHYARWRCEWK